jgi:hypothetical protein
MTTTWPTASLDRIARLRVLSAGLPGTAVVETEFDLPFDEVWSRLTDLERAVPEFDGDVRRLQVLDRWAHGAADGETLRIASYQSGRVLWLRTVLDVELAPGWCWMVSRPQAYVVGMAAEPLGPDRTRFAILEGVAFDLPRPLRRLQPLLRPIYAVSRWRHRRHIPHDTAGMHAYLAH